MSKVKHRKRGSSKAAAIGPVMKRVEVESKSIKPSKPDLFTPPTHIKATAKKHSDQKTHIQYSLPKLPIPLWIQQTHAKAGDVHIYFLAARRESLRRIRRNIFIPMYISARVAASPLLRLFQYNFDMPDKRDSGELGYDFTRMQATELMVLCLAWPVTVPAVALAAIAGSLYSLINLPLNRAKFYFRYRRAVKAANAGDERHLNALLSDSALDNEQDVRDAASSAKPVLKRDTISFLPGRYREAERFHPTWLQKRLGPEYDSIYTKLEDGLPEITTSQVTCYTLPHITLVSTAGLTASQQDSVVPLHGNVMSEQQKAQSSFVVRKLFGGITALKRGIKILRNKFAQDFMFYMAGPAYLVVHFAIQPVNWLCYAVFGRSYKSVALNKEDWHEASFREDELRSTQNRKIHTDNGRDIEFITQAVPLSQEQTQRQNVNSLNHITFPATKYSEFGAFTPVEWIVMGSLFYLTLPVATVVASVGFAFAFLTIPVRLTWSIAMNRLTSHQDESDEKAMLNAERFSQRLEAVYRLQKPVVMGGPKKWVQHGVERLKRRIKIRWEERQDPVKNEELHYAYHVKLQLEKQFPDFAAIAKQRMSSPVQEFHMPTSHAAEHDNTTLTQAKLRAFERYLRAQEELDTMAVEQDNQSYIPDDVKVEIRHELRSHFGEEDLWIEDSQICGVDLDWGSEDFTDDMENETREIEGGSEIDIQNQQTLALQDMIERFEIVRKNNHTLDKNLVIMLNNARETLSTGGDVSKILIAMRVQYNKILQAGYIPPDTRKNAVEQCTAKLIAGGGIPIEMDESEIQKKLTGQLAPWREAKTKRRGKTLLSSITAKQSLLEDAANAKKAQQYKTKLIGDKTAFFKKKPGKKTSVFTDNIDLHKGKKLAIKQKPSVVASQALNTAYVQQLAEEARKHSCLFSSETKRKTNKAAKKPTKKSRRRKTKHTHSHSRVSSNLHAA